MAPSLFHNTDLVWIISEFIPANPVVFCELASVNKSFYHVFTSDKVWRPLNVNNSTNIYREFIKELEGNQRDIVGSWLSGIHYEPQSISNKWVKLGKLASHWHGTIDEPDEWLLKLAIDINPGIYELCSSRNRNNEDIFTHLCTRTLSLEGDATPQEHKDFQQPYFAQFGSKELHENTKLLEKIIHMTRPLDIFAIVGLTQDCPDMQWLLECAVKYNPLVLAYVTEETYDKIIHDRQSLVEYSESCAAYAEVISFWPSYDEIEHLSCELTKCYGDAFQSLPELFDDRDLWLKALAQVARMQDILPELRFEFDKFDFLDFWEDLEVVIAIINVSPWAISNVSPTFSSNKELAVVLIRALGERLGSTVRQASYLQSQGEESSQSDSSEPFDYIDKQLWNLPEVYRLLIEFNLLGVILYSSPTVVEELHDNEDFMRLAVENFSWTWNSASERLKNNRELLIEALRDDEFEMDWFPPLFYSDREIVDRVSQMEIFNTIPDEYVNRDSLKENIRRFGLRNFPQHGSDLELVTIAVEADPEELKHASTLLQQDPKLQALVSYDKDGLESFMRVAL